jgi:hypothetical protein
MNKIKWLSLLLLALTHLAPAQMDKPSHPATLATSQVIDSWITNTETHLVPVAEVMPATNIRSLPAMASSRVNSKMSALSPSN